ncbi:hypothetical protein ACS0TY_027307 [Phlomoides rotata]
MVILLLVVLCTINLSSINKNPTILIQVKASMEKYKTRAIFILALLLCTSRCTCTSNIISGSGRRRTLSRLRKGSSWP